MNKKEFLAVFSEIYRLLKRVHVDNTIVVNFSIPKAEQDYIFAYCVRDICVFDYKGEIFTNDGNTDEIYELDSGSVISFNPRLLKMDTECIRNTIAHELIHTVDGCEHHNSKFLRMSGLAFKVLKNTEFNLLNEIDFIGTSEESELLQKLAS